MILHKKTQYLKTALNALVIAVILIFSMANASPAFADDGIPPAPIEEPDISFPTIDTPADDSTQIDEAPAATSDILDQPSTEEPDLSSPTPTVDAPSNASSQVDEAPAATSDTLDQLPTEDTDLSSPPGTPNDPAQIIVEEPTTVNDVLNQLPIETAVVIMIDGQVEPLVTQDAAQAIATNDPWWCPGTSAPGSGGCATGSGLRPAFTGAGGLINWMLTNATPGGTIWIAYDYDSSTVNGGVGETPTITINGTAAGWTNPVRTGFLTIQGGWDNNTNGLGSITATPSQFVGDAFRVINWGNTVTINNITITGAAGATVATGTGLNVTTSGDINLGDVQSNGNAFYGALLNNTSGTGNVTLTGTNTFNNNTGNDGLRVTSTGTIAVNNVTASSNGAYGAYLDNNPGVGGVTISGTNTFNNNTNDGIRVATLAGNIVAENITAGNTPGTGNGGYGAFLNNCISVAGACTGSGNVTLTGTNTFSNNVVNDGLRIWSTGTVDLDNITAGNNGAYGLRAITNGNITLKENVTAIGNKGVYGVYLDNEPGAGYITNGTWNIFSSNNVGGGLRAVSTSTITLNNVTAEKNGTYGAFLTNTVTPSSSVTLTGTNKFNDNVLNDGLRITSDGDVELSNVTANGNKGIAAYGLRVVSPGAITLNNVTANGNGTYGANLNNTTSVTNSAVTLNGTNTFNDNLLNDGLRVLSTGAITLSDVTAERNRAYGAYLDNDPGNGGVTLSGANIFSNNYLTGLQVSTTGNFSASSVTADSNGITGNANPATGYGANLSTGNVTVSGTNSFSANYSTGLNVVTAGTISINNTTASNNKNSYGAFLDNSLGSGSVTLNGTNVFKGNGSDGLRVLTKGAIDIVTITAGNDAASGNGGNGANLDNSAGNGDVKLNGAGTFNGNASSGLKVFTNGATSLDNITASNNTGGYGAYLNAQGPGNPVTLNGTNVFNNNLLDGLYIDANGSISINSVTANSNGASGLFLQSAADITLNCCTTAADNGGAGAYADLPGSFFLRMGNFNGNGSGEYILMGGGKTNIAYCSRESENNAGNIAKPIRKVTLTSEQVIPLECTAFSGTMLILPNGASAYLPCPIGDRASLLSLTEADLANALPEGVAFTSGFNLRVETDAGSFSVGGEAAFANVTMTISFVIPESQLGTDLALLSWNGSKWVEVKGAIVEDGYITAQVNYDGLFVLASK